MKFSFSAEQEEFRSNLRRSLADASPTKEVRRLMETDAGWDRDGWHELNNELGLTAVRIPEAYGGHGFGFGELGIVLEEMGRGLLCAPYLRHRRAGRRRDPERRHRGAEAGAAAGHRRRRDDGDAGLLRGRRPQGCRQRRR